MFPPICPLHSGLATRTTHRTMNAHFMARPSKKRGLFTGRDSRMFPEGACHAKRLHAIFIMITDPLFYRLFETSPETFFLLLGMSGESALDMAARYQYQAIEFKETAHRADGVFLPKEPKLPLYFLEVQFYRLPSIYADLLAKVFTYLKQHDPAQTYCGVVLFGDRSLEPTELAPYQSLLDAGLIR